MPTLTVSAFPPAEIIVTGRALPTGGARVFAPVVIDRDRLTLNASGRIENILSDLTGFQSFRRADSRASNPTAQGTMLRGLGGNASARVLVLLDGVPQVDPFFGSVAFNALVPGQLGEVRITRGASGGPFGLGGVAGVVELDSAGPDQLSPTQGDLAVGSRHSVSGNALIAPRWDGGFATLAGHLDHGGGFFTTPDSQRVAASVSSAYDDYSVGARVVTALGGGDLQASARLFDDHRVLRFRGATNSSEGRDLSLRWVRRGDWSVDALAYAQQRDFSTVVVSSTSFRPVLNQRATPSTGVGGRVELRSPTWDGVSLRVGVDARRSAGTTYEDSLAATGATTSERQAGGHQLDLGAYGEVDAVRGPVALTLGGRIDRWRDSSGHVRTLSPTGAITSSSTPADTDGRIPSGRAGAKWQVAKPVAVRVAAYASARLPTLNELYRTFTVFPVTTLANPALKPERLRGAEIGLDLAPVRDLALNATLFDNRLANAIANVTTGLNQRQRRNVAAIASRGVEFDGKWAFPHGSLTASWTAYRSRVRSSDALDGKRPAQTPGTASSATLTLDPVKAIALSATVRHTGGAFEDDLNFDRLPAFTTVDAAARWTFAPHLSAELRAENVGDVRAITRNQAGSLDLGVPRSVWFALSFR